MTAADIEVVLDIREYRQEKAGRALLDPAELQALWDQIEGALVDRDLSARPVHTLGHPNGDIHVRVVRINPASSPVVSPGTTFQITTVLDPPQIRYRCQRCPKYGPFLCRDCGEDRSARLCDDHVLILDGSLLPTCEKHRPTCAECGGTASFRCTGRSCRSQKAHCDRHRVVHPHDPDHAYCPSCFAEKFPRCEIGSCRNIGASPCEIVDAGVDPCGARVCAMHLRRWQVFGGEALGLALCARHSRSLPQVTAEELVRQIVVATYNRSLRRGGAEPLPSLRGFAHSIRPRHAALALDFDWIFSTLSKLENGFAAGPDRARLRQLLQERRAGDQRGRVRKPWQQEKQEIGGANMRGAQLVEQLRALVRQVVRHDADAVARSISLASYRAPRQVQGAAQPGLLFVKVPEQYRGAFKGRDRANIDFFAQQLSLQEPGGVTVRIDDDKRGGGHR
ncbi:hypothetical protein Cs7R123_01820 [Catellatospora sp. TT07R-123]|uniref:hypothetical protein n=1 Tax=Catellatospora sp. TT07R-123 TaxID=2733863 RepID=UPI001B1B0A9E|nr:hypothetical protein [Catellatospora sp. TT07R-123]GHJ42840.1 hypothetical protein Cs7R123_01820 [Catellatospora sp. TT07R-123]